MTSATQFAQYLLRLDPQRVPGRLALYNYLKHLVEPNEVFSPSTISGFYAFALNFDHWQNNAQSLGREIRADLEGWLGKLESLDDDWEKIRHADQIQVVNLRQSRDFEAIIAAPLESGRKSGDRYKLVRISDNELVSIYLTALGSLEVKVFTPRGMIDGRNLIPLAPVTQLFYSAGMELVPQIRQRIQGSLMTTISFFTDENGLNGMITRGHSFQKFETFLRARGGDNHDLFRSLKRLERHYIDPQSDPYYQEIVHALERANRSLQSPSARGLNLQMAEKTLQKGHSALRNAFPNDRLLQLLITHLEYGIRQAYNQTPGTAVEDTRSLE